MSDFQGRSPKQVADSETAAALCLIGLGGAFLFAWTVFIGSWIMEIIWRVL